MDWELQVRCERHLVFGELYEAANKMGNERAAEITSMAQSAKTMEEAALVAAEGDAFLYGVRAACAAALGVIGAVTEPGCTVEVSLAGTRGGIWMSVGKYDPDAAEEDTEDDIEEETNNNG